MVTNFGHPVGASSERATRTVCTSPPRIIALPEDPEIMSSLETGVHSSALKATGVFPANALDDRLGTKYVISGDLEDQNDV